MPIRQTRRRFLTTLSLAGTAGLLRVPAATAAEPPPETTTVRLSKIPAICFAPQYVAEELLRAEGFEDIQYVDQSSSGRPGGDLAHSKFDFASSFSAQHVIDLDAGQPITIIAGVHAGCYELFGGDRVRTVNDLKGKTVGCSASPELISIIAAYVGLDPNKDLRLVVADPKDKPLDQFAEGKFDAYMGFAPEPQQLRARGIGHVIVRTATDRPWSQYFCCTLAANKEFAARYPVATKRVLRAVLKAADLCASEPERAARRLIDGGFTDRYDYALQTLSELPYGSWREYDAEDTIRFYALRLYELGMIKTNPKRIIAEGTDWRFFDQLKRELKA